jgi:WD40 repeat protein
MTAAPVSTFPSPPPLVFGNPNLHADGDLLALAFARDGSLWSLEEPGRLRQWDASTGRPLQSHVLSDLETAWCFGPDARVLASASDELSAWDVASGELLFSIPQASWVTALAFSEDGSIIGTGHDDGAVRCWGFRARQKIAEHLIHKSPVAALAFQPGGASVGSAREDKTIDLWNSADEMSAGTLSGHTDRMPALVWHPNGKILVSAGWDGTARVWGAETLQPIILLNDHAAQVTALAFSSDGALLASADSADAVRIWSVADWRVLHVLKGNARDIRCLAFRGDGHRLAAGGGDRIVHLWDPRSGAVLLAEASARRGQETRAEPGCTGIGSARRGQETRAAPGRRACTGIALSPDGSRLVSVGESCDLQLWDARRASLIEGSCLGQAGPVNTVAYSPNGRAIAVGGDDALVRVWDVASDAAPRILEGQDDPVTVLAFSPDSSLLASASSTGTSVWLWSVPMGDPELLIPDALDGCTVEGLAFHPGGRLLAVGGIDWLATGGSDGATSLWDIVERCEVATLPGGTTCLAIHPSGRWLATASLVYTICIWDVETHALLAELPGPDDRINGVAFSPSGRWLAAGGDDRTIRLWSFKGGQPSAEPVLQMLLETQIKSLCFGPDGRSLFTANGNTTYFRIDVGAHCEELSA